MIGSPLERAIEDLGNYGVKADIMCLRNLESDQHKLALRLQEVQALEAYTQKRRAEFRMYQLAHVRHTMAVRQCLVRVNARERLLQLVDEDSERGELAWQHRTNRRWEAPYHKTGALHLRGGVQSAISWNSENAQDDALAQDEYEECRCCSYCPWFDHISTHCKNPHFLCSTRTFGWCHIPRHHRYFCNQMPDTCPYRGWCKHANGRYLTCQHTAWNLSLQDQQTEYDHLKVGCDDLYKGEMSRAGIAMRQAITQVVLDEFEGVSPSYAPRSPSPNYDYVPGNNKGSD
jgi:hypothetical protein